VLVLGAGTIGLCSALVARDRAAAVAVTARYPHHGPPPSPSV
jgi:threonine dehydrogenase-like Zn-dependent dehydrogenase